MSEEVLAGDRDSGGGGVGRMGWGGWEDGVGVGGAMPNAMLSPPE